MKIAFISNFFNHHQKYLSDELYKLLGEGNYFFVSTTDIPEERKKMGYQEMTESYVLHLNDNNKRKIEHIIDTFDAIIIGEAPISLVKKRYRERKLTFYDSERRYKTISRYLKYPIHTYKSMYINKGYMLCASAFTPKDYGLSGMSLNKCFRWGYFPEVKEIENIDAFLAKKKTGSYKNNLNISILWAGRLIGLKHPEAAIYVAEKLKSDNVQFQMNIIGNGYLENKLLSVINKKKLDDKVHLLGSMTPSQVRDYMERSDIFLFTSCRHEGWGAVMNESMGSACAVVASNAPGSVPYLIKDGENGIIYRSGKSKDLYQKVKYLIENYDERIKIQKAAYFTIKDVWSPKNASHRLIRLIEALQQGQTTPFKEGPCSPAPLLYDRWII